MGLLSIALLSFSIRHRSLYTRREIAGESFARNSKFRVVIADGLHSSLSVASNDAARGHIDSAPKEGTLPFSPMMFVRL